MGILNVTPDSFSDGGQHCDVDVAVQTALQMQSDGADIIDIGGESTRPYSTAVSAAEETDRIAPVIERLSQELQIPISIDTSKASVAKVAIQLGAEIINDVTGLKGDREMPSVAVDSGVGVCVMHMQGTPQSMQDNPMYENVVDEICDYLIQRRNACLELGIGEDRICLDPGIGFGKTHQHNLQLLQATRRLANLGSPILIGHSRKGFIAHVLNDRDADRTVGTIGVSLAVAAAGAHIIRVHDVKSNVDALRLFRVCGAIGRFDG
ncbi:dihydropteroate synthase [Planctomycetes bacterium K23_9]